MSFQILTDATADLSPELIAQYGLDVVPMQIMVDNDEYTHYPDEREIDMGVIYARLRAGSSAHTNSISPGIYEEYFEKYLRAGTDVLYIAFSSGLSSTFQTSVQVAQELTEKYPGRKVLCVDSLCASVGQALLVVHAAQQKAQGLSLEAVARWVEDNRLHLCHWFTVEDLEFLHRGGRVSAAAAIVGGALQIKPVLHVDNVGHLILVEKTRGRRRSVERLGEHMLATGIDLDGQEIFIGHADDEACANQLADWIRAHTKVAGIRLLKIGPVIGSHSGPGTIALFYVGRER